MFHVKPRKKKSVFGGRGRVGWKKSLFLEADINEYQAKRLDLLGLGCAFLVLVVPIRVEVSRETLSW